MINNIMYEIRTYFSHSQDISYCTNIVKYEIPIDEVIDKFHAYINTVKTELNREEYSYMIETDIDIYLMEIKDNCMFPITIGIANLIKYGNGTLVDCGKYITV